MRKVITILLSLVFFAGGFVSAYKIFQILGEYREGGRAYDELNVFAPVIDEESEDVQNQQTESESGTEEAPADNDKQQPAPLPVAKAPDFAALSAINTDAVAWIYAAGGSINYPVAQSGDNEYYLTHLFNKNYNGSGCIFLDCRNSPGFTDRNSVIYGHSMKNGTMFASLKKYKKQSFYYKYPAFRLFMPDSDLTVEIFAGYVASPDDRAWRVSFENDDDFALWIEERIEKSAFKSNILPSANDTVITLSTCTYEFNDARFVLFGRIVQNE